MEIRTATMNDLDAVAAVEAECFPVAEAATKEEFAERIKYYGDHFWLMFEGDKLIAFLDGFVTDVPDLTDEMYAKASMHDENGAWQMLFGLNTLPEYRKNGCAPLHITGSSLHGITYSTPVASAQVKSSILLAGLYADGQTSVTEPALSRNHTELMLSGFGADICSDGLTATITPGNELYAQQIFVPGDISSAAYFLAAGLLVPGSELLIRNVGINPTRAGILTVIRAMGGNLTVLNERVCAGEPVADLLVSASSLHGTTVEGNLIPALIDEIPMIAVMAAFANGQTVIRDAAELKVKESDRIATVTAGLRAMGCDITPTDDGMIIRGGKTLHGAEIDSYLDHRIAMSFAVAALAADGVTSIKDADCVKISYPNFYDDLLGLAK